MHESLCLFLSIDNDAIWISMSSRGGNEFEPGHSTYKVF